MLSFIPSLSTFLTHLHWAVQGDSHSALLQHEKYLMILLLDVSFFVIVFLVEREGGWVTWDRCKKKKTLSNIIRMIGVYEKHLISPSYITDPLYCTNSWIMCYGAIICDCKWYLWQGEAAYLQLSCPLLLQIVPKTTSGSNQELK